MTNLSHLKFSNSFGHKAPSLYHVLIKGIRNKNLQEKIYGKAKSKSGQFYFAK